MSVTTRRERRQQQRRREQQRRPGRAGSGVSQLWIVGGVVLALVALILIGRAAGVFEPAPSSPVSVQNVDPSGPRLGEHQQDRGNGHIAAAQKASYPSLPPTSGEHWGQPQGPAPWGVKSSWLPFEVTTHNLEHGGIVIMYNGLETKEVQQLQAIVRDMSSQGFNKIILEPWPDMKDAKVICTAWNWILKLQSLDAVSIVKFTKQHYDDEAPEKGVM